MRFQLEEDDVSEKENNTKLRASKIKSGDSSPKKGLQMRKPSTRNINDGQVSMKKIRTQNTPPVSLKAGIVRTVNAKAWELKAKDSKSLKAVTKKLANMR